MTITAPTDARYNQFIELVFNHPDGEDEWMYDDGLCDSQTFNDDVETAQLIRRTMEHCGEDLSHFSDWQTGKGLYYIFYNVFSDYSFSLREDAVPLEIRLAGIRSIKNLYEG